MRKKECCGILLLVLFVCPLFAQTHAPETPENVSSAQFASEVTQFLGREMSAHVADIRLLEPPQDRVAGALTTGDFSWGAFGRALASYSALSGERTIAAKDPAKLIGQMGLIESKRGGKTFAQLHGAIALLHFGKDLKTNAVWQAMTPEEQAAWKSLLDPSRFYDRKTRRVIHLPENYFGVAARVVAIDYTLGLISDRAFVDDVLNRAAEQFVAGAIYSDDAIPSGRYDRYSNEYARFVYLSAELVGRTDIMKAMEPSLKRQMALWWDLLSPDGYGYPWGRSLGDISYIDTLEIVGFLCDHPQFRPAPLAQLAAAYHAAWQSLIRHYQSDRHLLDTFGFGRGNYGYINREREWQQTGTFFGKAADSFIPFLRATKAEGVTSFPFELRLPDVARFEFFRKGERPSGVWIVRNKQIRFALPLVSGPKPGISDYLPMPYNLSGFAPPVEQHFPAMTPYLEIEGGNEIVAADCADEILPSPDGLSLRAVWNRWAVSGKSSGETLDSGIKAEVTWTLDSNSLVRKETITVSHPIVVRRYLLAIPSTGDSVSTTFESGNRVDLFHSTEGSLEASILQSDWRPQISVHATGNTALGKGSRGPVPLYLKLESRNVTLTPDKPLQSTLVLRSTTDTKHTVTQGN